jgi:hypothetical protein
VVTDDMKTGDLIALSDHFRQSAATPRSYGRPR